MDASQAHPGSHEQRSDEQLVSDHAAGDADAFRVLVERYHDPLLRFLIRLTGSRAAAEDVFQETFLQVHTSLDSFDVSRRFKPWLFTIAANKGRDALRRSARRAAVSLDAPVDDSSGGGGGGGSFVDLMEIELDPVGAPLESAERAELVQAAVDDLAPRLREVLLLAYFQKMSYAQVADVLGVPLGTVKSRLHAAVAAFAKAWQAQLDARAERVSENRTRWARPGAGRPADPPAGT